MSPHWKTSTIADGPMGQTIAMTEEHCANRVRFIRTHFGDSALAPVMVESVHGALITVAAVLDAGMVLSQCDGLVTTERNLPLVITHQDCVPIVITDRGASFICVLHAGWRGVVAGIFPAALRRIKHQFTIDTPLSIVFGPSLQSCHFEVQDDVALQFRAIAAESVTFRDGKLFVDMHAALRRQARNLGIADAQIEASGDCTFCTQGYASWRRDRNREANMITVAMLS